MQQGSDQERGPSVRSLSVKEVADRLGVSSITVYRHLRSGKLPFFKFGGSIRVLERDLETFILIEKRKSAVRQESLRELRTEVPQPSEEVAKARATWWGLLRPTSWSASVASVLLGGAVAWQEGKLRILLFLLVAAGAVVLHAGINVVNRLFDARESGPGLEPSPEAAGPPEGQIRPGEAYRLGLLFFGLAALVGAYLVAVRGYPVAALGAAAAIMGYFYTAPPVQFRYSLLGVPAALAAMGPAAVLGTYYIVTGQVGIPALVASVPLGLLAAALVRTDAPTQPAGPLPEGGNVPPSSPGVILYLAPLALAYVALGVLVGLQYVPLWGLLALVSLPLAARGAVLAWRAPTGQGASSGLRAVTLLAYVAFGVLLSVGFFIQGALDWPAFGAGGA